MLEKKVTIQDIHKIIKDENEKLAIIVNNGFLIAKECNDKRFDKMDQRFDDHDRQLEALGVGQTRMERKIIALEDRIDDLSQGQEEIKKKLDGVVYRSELKKIKEEIKEQVEKRLKKWLLVEMRLAKT